MRAQKIENIQRQHPHRITVAPDANSKLSDSKQKTASGNMPESLLLPSRPDCWLRDHTELAERSRAVTASREHARFRRKLYDLTYHDFTRLSIYMHDNSSKQKALKA